MTLIRSFVCACGTILALGACREPLEPAPAPAVVMRADQYLAQLVIEPGTGSDRWIVRVTLTAGPSTTRVAGFQARLVVPTALTVEEGVADQSAARGAMTRAVHSDGIDVLAAGASAEGMPIGDLFVVPVRGSASALAGLRLELTELVDVRSADQRARTVVSPWVNDSRIRR